MLAGKTDSLQVQRGGAARTMPAYDDGSTPTLVTEKPPAIAVRTAQTGANGCGIDNEPAHTVDTTGPEAVAYAVRMRAGCDGGGKGALVQEGVSGTLATGNDQTLFQPESSGYVVRRLTPLECERLQGFPDGHTMVPYRGKPAEESPDGPRYKAIGNSMCVQVMAWIGRRIELVDAIINEADTEV